MVTEALLGLRHSKWQQSSCAYMTFFLFPVCVLSYFLLQNGPFQWSHFPFFLNKSPFNVISWIIKLLFNNCSVFCVCCRYRLVTNYSFCLLEYVLSHRKSCYPLIWWMTALCVIYEWFDNCMYNKIIEQISKCSCSLLPSLLAFTLSVSIFFPFF